MIKNYVQRQRMAKILEKYWGNWNVYQLNVFESQNYLIYLLSIIPKWHWW